MISVILPTKGRHTALRTCLSLIVEHTRNLKEVILVFGDTDIPEKALENFYFKVPVVIIHNPNSCYSDSMNKGCAIATGKYLTVPGIANDIEVTHNWDVALVEALENPGIGMAIPGVQEVTTDKIVYGGYLSPSLYNVNPYGHPHYAGYGLMTREIFDEIGPMDTNFKPIYLEDADYGIRINNAGYKIACCQDSLIIHRHDMEDRTYPSQANIDYFKAKWGITP